MNTKTYYYARVSSSTQHLDRQIAEFKELGAEDREIITDKESGASLNREGYIALKSTLLRPGDTLVIKSLDRLFRNKEDIKNELKFFKDNKIRVKIIDLPTTMADFPEDATWIQDMINNILIEVLSSIAQQERETIKKRQREGIDVALKNGIKFGRPIVELPDNWQDVYTLWSIGAITAVEAMRRTGLRKSTFYKFASVERTKRYKEQEELAKQINEI